jgi:hypothetical protein
MQEVEYSDVMDDRVADQITKEQSQWVGSKQISHDEWKREYISEVLDSRWVA